MLTSKIESKSQIFQDGIVLQLLNFKKSGTFVDIGCAEPIRFSNSYIMEKYFNWHGIGIDILDAKDSTGSWEELRPKTKHVLNDALSLDYLKLFKDFNLPKTIDYLSLDLEPPSITLECLYKIPFDLYTFNVITFETDEYRKGGEERKKLSRDYLKERGYIFQLNLNKQDDVYVHISLIERHK